MRIKKMKIKFTFHYYHTYQYYLNSIDYRRPLIDDWNPDNIMANIVSHYNED